MTDEEFKLWKTGRPQQKSSNREWATPCIDCPMWFAKEMRAKNCCNGSPGRSVRPRMVLGGRGRGYATEEARLEARRQAWRDAKRRKRQAA